MKLIKWIVYWLEGLYKPDLFLLCLFGPAVLFMAVLVISKVFGIHW